MKIEKIFFLWVVVNLLKYKIDWFLIADQSLSTCNGIRMLYQYFFYNDNKIITE